MKPLARGSGQGVNRKLSHHLNVECSSMCACGVPFSNKIGQAEVLPVRNPAPRRSYHCGDWPTTARSPTEQEKFALRIQRIFPKDGPAKVSKFVVDLRSTLTSWLLDHCITQNDGQYTSLLIYEHCVRSFWFCYFNVKGWTHERESRNFDDLQNPCFALNLASISRAVPRTSTSPTGLRRFRTTTFLRHRSPL